MADQEPTPWIPEETWQQSNPDAAHTVTVYDEDLGTLAEITHPDGTRIYGHDTPH